MNEPATSQTSTWRAQADRQARERRIAYETALETLRRHAQGLEPHLYYESCPTSNYPAQRDVRCPVCLALINTETQP